MPEARQPFTSEPKPDALPPVGRSDEEEIEAAKAANRFDIRRIIGGLFTVYGVILVILGIVGSSHVKHKASGINIDLWSGHRHARVRRLDDLLGAGPARGSRAARDSRRGFRADPPRARHVARPPRSAPPSRAGQL